MKSNLKISKANLDFIRSLENYDLTLLITEIQQHGWEGCEKYLLPFIRDAIATRAAKKNVQE